MKINDNITLYRGDCLDKMKHIVDHTVDMILCDLPYGTTKCTWDSIIPINELWEEYYRVIKPNGAIVLTAQQPFTTTLIDSNLKSFKYVFTWVKNTPVGFNNVKIRPLKVTEDVLVFNSKYYYPQGVIPCNKVVRNSAPKQSKHARITTTHEGGIYKESYVQEFSNYPRNLLYFNTEKGLHPTQKPVLLFEYLIKTYTLEDETVLDNCLGSGTTAIACINTNRKCIGIEKDNTYFDAATLRIKNHLLLLLS